MEKGILEGKLEVATELYHNGWQINDISKLIGINVEMLSQRLFG